jgi:hypothetical protein
MEDHLPAHTDDPALAWIRAARVVHEQERRLRQFIVETHRLVDALVVRMCLLWRPRLGDPVLSDAIRLRERLAAEARRPPVLHGWQQTFDRLEREHAEMQASLDEYLEGHLEERGLPDRPQHQLRFRFARRSQRA